MVAAGSDGLSLRNPKVQDLRRLVGRRRSRLEHRRFTFEGWTLLGEACRAGVALDAVYVDADAADDDRLAVVPDAVPVERLAPGVLARVSDTRTPQGVLAVARRPHHDLASVAADAGGWVIVLDGVGDPGNAGTVVRTADAFGAHAVVFAGDSADPYGPKTVRASAGSAFRVALVEHRDTADAVARLAAGGRSVFATVVAGGEPPDVVDLSGPVVVVLGSEAHGVGPSVLDLPVRRLTVPVDHVESLNVAATAAVLGYERSRQRHATG